MLQNLIKPSFCPSTFPIGPMNLSGFLFLFLFLCFSSVSEARQQTHPLYAEQAPNTITVPGEDVVGDGGRISQVAVPEITVYRPEDEQNNGMAILVCPGGGYRILAIQHEGHQIAEWYRDRGYTAAVLKYRLPDEELVSESWNVPLNDAMEGIRFLRERSDEWNYDPGKIGVLGFSAGGHLASSLSVHSSSSETAGPVSPRPDFSILVYPVISMDTTITHQGSRQNLLGEKLNTELENYYSNEKQVDEQTPPAFLVHSWDDTTVPPGNSIRYAKALQENGVKTELHLFEKGGHGYGAGNRTDHGNASEWLRLSDEWIQGLF